MEEQSNHFEAEILDDCIWTISKYQPVANHLRFVISIINSIKDLERMADYVISTAKFIYLHDTFDEEQIDLIIEGIQASISAVTEILNLLTIKKEDKINNEISIFQESTKIHSSYNDRSMFSYNIFKPYSEHIRRAVAGCCRICIRTYAEGH